MNSITILLLCLAVVAVAALAAYHFLYQPLNATAHALTASAIKKSMLDAIGLGDD
jgi:hypothetical protein